VTGKKVASSKKGNLKGFLMVFPVILHFWILEEYAQQRKELENLPEDKYEYFSIYVFFFV